MDTNVFINGREACSKATDGKSAGAFPDPCWSPPPPPVGPIVVPYSNTAYARDLQNGTATVFICKTMVAQKDRSFFSTSQGNEPATPGFQKGISSGVIKGKSYFKSWSQNVKFEGLEVPRHEDIMTHNHGSTANTPPSYYMDSAKVAKECAKQMKKWRSIVNQMSIIIGNAKAFQKAGRMIKMIPGFSSIADRLCLSQD